MALRLILIIVTSKNQVNQSFNKLKREMALGQTMGCSVILKLLNPI
jgi:hypothetical protein